MHFVIRHLLTIYTVVSLSVMTCATVWSWPEWAYAWLLLPIGAAPLAVIFMAEPPERSDQ